MTSTYDHRVIQGAESGAFLRRVDQLLQGEDGFYEDVLEALGLDAVVQRRRRPARPVTAAEPVPAAATPAAAPVARRGAAPGGAGGHQPRQGAPHARPPGRAARPARLRAGRRPGARPRDREPHRRPDAPHPGVGAARGGPGRDASPTRCRACARPTRARSPTRSSTSPTTSSASGCARRSSRAPTASRSSAEEKRLLLAAPVRGRGARDLPAQGLPRARSSSRSRASTRSCRCSTRRSSWPPSAGAREVVLGMAHRGRLNVLAHTSAARTSRSWSSSRASRRCPTTPPRPRAAPAT